MVTAEEIGGSRSSRSSSRPSASGSRGRRPTSALVPGEYAVHEGDERALFAVLEGRIEAVKLVDGIERVVGGRQPGDIFGEVPIALGTRLPGRVPRRGAVARDADRAARLPRASRPSRPTSASEVGELAAHRIGGSAASRASRAEPPPPRAIVSGTLGRGVRRAAALPRPQPGHVQVAPAGRARRGRAVGRPAAGRGRLSR